MTLCPYMTFVLGKENIDFEISILCVSAGKASKICTGEFTVQTHCSKLIPLDDDMKITQVFLFCS